MSQHDQREKLFERAKYGEISGEEADAEAVRLGLSRFSSEPGPDEFRPEDLTHWTLPMALAWIAYMDLKEVREWSAPYRPSASTGIGSDGASVLKDQFMRVGISNSAPSQHFHFLQ